VPRYEVAELVDEFEEEDEYELRGRRRRSGVGTVVAVVAGILVALIILALLMETGLIPTPNDFEPTAVDISDVSGPAIPGFLLDRGDPAPTPGAGGIGFSFSLSWTTTDVYSGFGGALRVNFTNTHTTDVYVKQVTFVPEWAEPHERFTTGWGRLVPPGEERYIGLLGFSGPSSGGSYSYHFSVDVLVKRQVLNQWAVSSAETDPQTMEVKPVQAEGSYPVYKNDPDIYRKVNDLIDPDDPLVVQVANQVSAGLGETYNTYWVLSLFDWLLDNLEYNSDPSDEDIWSPPGETCSLGSGDCEDFSIVIASVVEHWGGNARFYVISRHAFAAIYLGPTDMNTEALTEAMGNYYGTAVRAAWFVDDLGYWIIADGTSAQYLGGLPYHGVATDLSGGWDIQETEYLHVVDIYPDYPE
jgi:transglutaminase-like putative cysteine protease